MICIYIWSCPWFFLLIKICVYIWLCLVWFIYVIISLLVFEDGDGVNPDLAIHPQWRFYRTWKRRQTKMERILIWLVQPQWCSLLFQQQWIYSVTSGTQQPSSARNFLDFPVMPRLWKARITTIPSLLQGCFAQVQHA